MLTEAEAAQFLLNKNKIKELEEANEELLTQAGVRTEQLGTYSVGRFIVEVGRNARFNAALAAEKYPLSDDTMKLYKAEVDGTLAKKHLSPAEYEQLQVVFPKNKVEIKLATK